MPRNRLLRALLPAAMLAATTVASAATPEAIDSGWILAQLARPAPMQTAFVELRDSPLLKAPLRWFMKLLLNMAIGIVMLFVFNFIGGFFDFSLGINALNALVAGILGIPGVILLVLVKLFL